MKIGILVLFVNSFGKRGLYNPQEIGIAKELSRRGHSVTIYKCVSKEELYRKEEIYPKVMYEYRPVRTIGNNAISDFEWLDKGMDILVCFSDIQLLVHKVYKWTKKNQVRFIPYVGITESTSASKIVRSISNANSKLVFNTYKKTGVLAKTNEIRKRLERIGIKKVRVAPVGLDFELLNAEYSNSNMSEIKQELGLSVQDKYILLVGRLANDRNPLDCVETFEKVHSRLKEYKLLIIGKGPLKDELFTLLREKKLMEYIKYIEQVPNSDMWKYYRSSECLISFSRTEIFGMSLLEAMFYETPVYVIHAPGPNDIIENGVSGYLFNTSEEMANAIIQERYEMVKKPAHKRVLEKFSWNTMADLIESYDL